MSKFKVHVPEVWIQTYEVEADDEQHARSLIGTDSAVPKDALFEYSHTIDNDDREWEVEHG